MNYVLIPLVIVFAHGLGERAAVLPGAAQIGQSRRSAALGELVTARFDEQTVMMVQRCTKLQQPAEQHMDMR